MNPIEQAEKVLVDIRARRTAQQGRMDEIIRERIDVALPAQHDAKARKRLDALLIERVALAAETESTDIAIAQADLAVQTAQRAAQDEIERANAEKALAMLQSFADRGKRLDAAFDAALQEFRDLEKDVRDLETLGYAPVSMALMVVNMRRAASTKLMFSGLQTTFLAPGERIGFVEAIAGWARLARGKAQARINRQSSAAA